MANYVIKVKSKTGQHLVDTFNENSTLESLKSRIAELTQLNADTLHMLVGFPPKPLDTNINSNTLKVSGIHNGDTIIVEEKAGGSPIDASEKLSKLQLEADKDFAEQLSEDRGDFAGILLKTVVPADNSCLFTSVGKYLVRRIILFGY